MRGAIHKAIRGAIVVVAVSVGASTAIAQMDLSGIKMAEPSPELPGDRAMSCAQIAAEMGEIMNKRGMKRGIASSKSKICASTKVLNEQGEERQEIVGCATAFADCSQCRRWAGCQRSIPARPRPKTRHWKPDSSLNATARWPDMGSGMGDMLGVMNDPRLMRLGHAGAKQAMRGVHGAEAAGECRGAR